MEDQVVKNNWRFGREWPPMIGEKGDGLSVVLLFISLPLVAMFGSMAFYIIAVVAVVRNVAKFKGLSVLHLFMSLFKWLLAEKSGCSSIRQKNLLSIAGLIFIGLGQVSDVKAVEVIRALPDNIVEIKKPAFGEFFIDNIAQVTGHGTATLDKLLTFLVKENHDYQIIYNDSELAQMTVTWRSLPPRIMTLDQVLGSLSIRYGIMFFTPRGASEIHVAWLRDETECNSKNNGVFIALCGVDLGRY